MYSKIFAATALSIMVATSAMAAQGHGGSSGGRGTSESGGAPTGHSIGDTGRSGSDDRDGTPTSHSLGDITGSIGDRSNGRFNDHRADRDGESQNCNGSVTNENTMAPEMGAGTDGTETAVCN